MFLATTLLEWIIPIGAGLLLGLLFASRKNVDPTQLIDLTAEDFSANMRKGQLIDIRPEEEFKKTHINGSKNFPKKTVMANLHKLRADQAVFIVGPSRFQMRKIAKKLFKKGFRPIYMLSDGLENYPYPLKQD